MVLYLKAGGELRSKLKLAGAQDVRRIETEAGRSLSSILAGIGINPSLVAFAFKNDTLMRVDQIPGDGDVITLQPLVSGG